MKSFIIVCCAASLLSSCAIVYQGEVGIKRRLGILSNKVYKPGPVTYNPFTSKVLRLPTRTVNKEIQLDLPSKEGLSISATISILYHIKQDKAWEVLETVGMDYENTMILSTFRSAAADVSSRFFAKDLHSGERSVIEREIQNTMAKLIEPRGFIIESVLMKSIKLPAGLSKAIEDKLEAEQQAQRMEFTLLQERKEAERKKIAAEGTRDAQKIIAEGITPEILKYNAIEAFKVLSTSNNSKVIITNGTNPLMLETGK
jgi:prohibitin 1